MSISCRVVPLREMKGCQENTGRLLPIPRESNESLNKVIKEGVDAVSGCKVQVDPGEVEKRR